MNRRRVWRSACAFLSTVRLFAVVVGLVCWPAVAHAGMPRATAVLTELAQFRLQSISFFLASFLLLSWLIQLLWNGLRRDMTFLPRLSYLRAVGLVSLWGLLFLLVLTMISGARELMTPGAWEPNGVTYKLKGKPALVDETLENARKQRLTELKEALWQYAKTHGGQFPPSRTDPAIAREKWLLPDASGLQYVYAGGTASAFDSLPLAYEPEIFHERWVLFTDGSMKRLNSTEIGLALLGEKSR